MNDYHAHLVGQGVEMMMWGSPDRWPAMLYGLGGLLNDTAEAMTMILKDIIICDWHYEPRDSYPPCRTSQRMAFGCSSPLKGCGGRLLWATPRERGAGWSGVLFTGWSAGDGGRPLRALCGEAEEEPVERAAYVLRDPASTRCGWALAAGSRGAVQPCHRPCRAR